jgi:hypothetical protein
MNEPVPDHAEDPIAPSFSDDELLELKRLASKPTATFCRNYPLLVAIAAFALSLSTTLISAYTSYRKDVHDEQAQLAASIQTIQDLMVKQAEVYEKYKGTAYAAPTANLITAQINTMLRTASELAIRLGTSATTAELTTVAQGLYATGDHDLTRQLLQTALASAHNANDESIALRYLGFMEIRSAASPEQRKAGEQLFARAAALDQKYDLTQLPYMVHFLRAVAEFGWADAIAPLDCNGSKAHFADAVNDLLANPRTPEMDQMRRTERGAYTNGIGGIAACRPPDQPVLPPA